MENEVINAGGDETPVLNTFYGLTVDNKIIVLPEAEYPSTALHKFNNEREQAGESAQEFALVFNDFQYRALLSQVDAELNDVDGDGMIPSYLIIPLESLTAVFSHPSVDTDEEAAEFLANYPMLSVGPIKLADVRDTWPKVE